MKNPLDSKFLVRCMLGISLTLIVVLASTLRAVEPGMNEPMTAGAMKDDCKEMQAHKQKAMAAMKAQDAELTAQVTAMNSAPENKRLALMAAILTRMVEQRAAMHQQAEKMHDEMMRHMMKHDQMGGGSMSQCPMMKDMDGHKGNADTGHQPPAAK